ncbi:Disease resistance protein L6 [Linum perenne]
MISEYESSLLPLPTGEYEVFLSFRGPDVRQTFADCLYSCLVRSKIRTFRDQEELRKGETIGLSLVKAITESKIHIPILTKSYASSKWCLQELAKMVACWKSGGGENGQHIILPVFYFIDPRDVRHPDSDSYKEAFEQHSFKHDPESILEWKEALQEVGKMKGWHVTESDGHGAVIDQIFTEVELHLRANYTLVTDELVGIDFHVEEVMKLLNLGSSSERIVGIHGMGGLGKTTLAKAVYNKVLSQFERGCFLDNIRDTLSEKDGVVNLQNKIITEILRKDSNKAKNASDGIRAIKDRVCRHKLIIVLDDVDERFQFDDILGKLNDFSVHSRFLITTRDARVLELLQECKLFELGQMNHDHSVKLFSKHAFRLEHPPRDYAHLSEKFVQVAGGLPLFLKVIGSLLFQTGKIEEPNYMWRDCDFYPASTVRTLVQRSLLKINENEGFWMHDHVRDLGRAIVKGESNQDPYKSSRIWSNRDAIDMLKHRKKMVVLECEYCSVKDGWREWNQIKVAQKLKVLNLSWCDNLEKVPDLSNCRGLELLHFRGCRSMHGELDIRNLTHLKVLGVGKTNITKLKGKIGKLQNLQKIDVSHTRLIELPAGISELSSLEFLDLTLTDPNKPHLSETLPGSLKTLAISSSSLPVLPSSLNFLDICYCEHLKRLPSLANLTNLTGLHLKKVGVREIPGLGELKLLETLYIDDCPRLGTLDGLENLLLLKELCVQVCPVLEKLPSLSKLTKLHKLEVRWCMALVEIHGVGELWDTLLHLFMGSCSSLTGIEALHSMDLLKSQLGIPTLKKLATSVRSKQQLLSDYLYTFLVNSKIRTFRDEEGLQRGEFIAPSLVKAITESKIYIPIFSKNYASSKWCLQELAKMVECWRSGGGGKGQHIILPVFYFIHPRDVRHPDSGSYKEAFEQHSLKHDPETLLEWKEALQEVGKMKGWHITESHGQGAIIDEIFSEVDIHLRANYTLMTDELVGIDSQVEDVVKLLNLDSASEKIVGIHGMGGLGKTTLAKAVYNKVSTQFEGCCFLENIKDTLSKKDKDGVLVLQNKIISDTLRKHSYKANDVKDVNDGIRVIRDRVSRQKLLIVLDDIDERFKFEDILGKLENFSVDSRFIVTTRDTRVLELLQGCMLFELEEMSCDHSLKLFSKHAFGVNYPLEDYASLSKEFVRVATGLPLYLKVRWYVIPSPVGQQYGAHENPSVRPCVDGDNLRVAPSGRHPNNLLTHDIFIVAPDIAFDGGMTPNHRSHNVATERLSARPVTGQSSGKKTDHHLDILQSDRRLTLNQVKCVPLRLL